MENKQNKKPSFALSMGVLVALVAMGWPSEEPNAPRRKGVEDLLEWR